MKRKYRLHWGEYAIGENEQLYQAQALRGWMLAKRGAWFSRFEKTEPQDLLYRVELSSPGFLDDDQSLPEEQLELYEQSGWRFVTRHGLVHVFCAPVGSGAPEIHTDPGQQAQTLKALRRSYLFCWVPAAMLIVFFLVFSIGLYSGVGATWQRWSAQMALGWVVGTQVVLFVTSVMLRAVYQLLHGGICVSGLYRRLKRGQPFNHEPRTRHTAHRVALTLLTAACLACGVAALAQWAGIQEYALPAQADGPYLLLEDLGWEGEHTALRSDDGSNTVQSGKSLLSRWWSVQERIDSGQSVRWLFQKVYVMNSEAAARAFVPTLMASATFKTDPAEYRQLDIKGLDLAYQAGMESIAVKGRIVIILTYSEDFPETVSQENALLEVLADRLARPSE